MLENKHIQGPSRHYVCTTPEGRMDYRCPCCLRLFRVTGGQGVSGYLREELFRQHKCAHNAFTHWLFATMGA